MERVVKKKCVQQEVIVLIQTVYALVRCSSDKKKKFRLIFLISTDANLCNCTTGYTGSSCSLFDCSLVNNCSSHGFCTGPNLCSCSTGYNGTSCSMFSCAQRNNCGGKGNCTGI